TSAISFGMDHGLELNNEVDLITRNGNEDIHSDDDVKTGLSSSITSSICSKLQYTRHVYSYLSDRSKIGVPNLKVKKRYLVSKFIVETFATNCCFYSVVDNSFDLRDANIHLIYPFIEWVVATGSTDKTVKLFDLRKISTALHTFDSHKRPLLGSVSQGKDVGGHCKAYEIGT
ncbi:hypothetical protein IFM89_035779, partial [Coptis chinensis]